MGEIGGGGGVRVNVDRWGGEVGVGGLGERLMDSLIGRMLSRCANYQ